MWERSDFIIIPSDKMQFYSIFLCIEVFFSFMFVRSGMGGADYFVSFSSDFPDGDLASFQMLSFVNLY